MSIIFLNLSARRNGLRTYEFQLCRIFAERCAAVCPLLCEVAMNTRSVALIPSKPLHTSAAKEAYGFNHDWWKLFISLTTILIRMGWSSLCQYSSP